MQKVERRIGYGNQQIGTVVDNFWLDRTAAFKLRLSRSPLLEKLANTQLAFKRSMLQHAVQDMLLIEQRNPIIELYAKSGWGMDIRTQSGLVDRLGRNSNR